jgi:hypothetical protein
MSKTPRHLPAGKLLPLPVPNRPWSHLGVDFVTDLPPSDGNTCILVIVDRFSKACRLLPLKALPTAMETAELMFNHVFRYFGIPEDIVSDRGPQFVSRVWRAFFKLLGVTISLSSGYHPQTNGADREEDTGGTPVPSDFLSRPPELLEPVHRMGRVCPELPAPTHYRYDSISMYTRFPTTHVSLVRGTLRLTCHGSLVPGEREGLGQRSSPSPARSE